MWKQAINYLEKKMYHILKGNKDLFENKQKTSQTHVFSKSPHLYGLPKVHKKKIPLYKEIHKQLLNNQGFL